MYPHQGGQGQQPPQWPQQPPSSQPPSGAYPPRQQQPQYAQQQQQQQQQQQLQSQAQQYPQPRPEMTVLHPQNLDPYRLPAPNEIYRGPTQQDYRGPLPHMAYAQHQPAPRQRTAIACRYCRRRKIRCSGFEGSEDGRCTNCQRFSQECIFTPVSAQTQAFVPAHAAGWRANGIPQQLYGAYGQPLPPQHVQDAYAPPPPRQQPMYPLPNPNTGYQGGPPPTYTAGPPPPAPAYDDGSGREAAGRKRPAAEPHTPTLPPPNPAAQTHVPGHHSSAGETGQYTYPDPTGLTPSAASPASSTASYQSSQPTAQPYYTSTAPPRRASPQSAYSYDPSRASSSPHVPGTARTPSTQYPQYGDQALRPPQQNLPVREGRTPPPTQGQSAQTAADGNRSGMSISSIVASGAERNPEGGRSAADSDMLKALNRRPM
ncbi:hypothetical protein LTR60_003698 [Cryomyces antarcticus]|nr:hypothetical protein LTR60_003698 [Cryomyces antarcticus]